LLDHPTINQSMVAIDLSRLALGDLAFSLDARGRWQNRYRRPRRKSEPTPEQPEAAAAAFEERQSEWQRLLRAEQEQERLREELEAEGYGKGREPSS
jgi:hypothetical protein